MKKEDTTVTFRLTPPMHERLIDQAKHSGVSKHALARVLVVRALDLEDVTQLTTALAEMEDGFLALRQAFGRGVAAILQNVTDLKEEEIREWVSRRLFSEKDGNSDSDFEKEEE